jgi:hypothetical protein
MSNTNVGCLALKLWSAHRTVLRPPSNLVPSVRQVPFLALIALFAGFYSRTAYGSTPLILYLYATVYVGLLSDAGS